MALHATLTRTLVPASWLRLGGTVAAQESGMLVFGDAWSSMARRWMPSPAYAHGVAIGPIAAVLAWRLRAELAMLPDRADARGAVAFVRSCAGWLLGQLAGLVVLAETDVRLPATDGKAAASPLGAELATMRGTLAGRVDHAALAWLAVSASDDAARDRAALAARSRVRQAFLAGDTGPPAPRAEPAR